MPDVIIVMLVFKLNMMPLNVDLVCKSLILHIMQLRFFFMQLYCFTSYFVLLFSFHYALLM